MSDESQIEIPPSFVALYVPPGRIKPTLPRSELAQRYELCEDMAQMLVDTARTLEFSLGITQADVLQRVAQGLQGEDAVVTEAEAGWVVTRLAELLGS
ncbi:ATPase with chaperone activity [Hydrogenophaga sp. R2]|uniref:ATPase with chaperone activity n=1 Tax=Hydrogenophaga sp. R2 TaxID=3132827 RepID=UPI003CF0A807